MYPGPTKGIVGTPPTNIHLIVCFVHISIINSVSFDSRRILYMAFEFWRKKGFTKNFGNFVVYFMTLSLYYVSLYCLWYELMLTFLFNFDHLANNLRIHNALFILNAYLRDWLRILKKILWCFLWFDDLNILEI